MKKLVGKISHYFGHLSVAVVDLTDSLKNGDRIEIASASGQTLLTQTVSSMQIEKTKISEAKAGQAIGLKVDAQVHAGNSVFKVTA